MTTGNKRIEPLIGKSSFIGLDSCTWLYSGAETPPHQGCLDAVQEYLRNRGMGPIGRDRNAETEYACKSNIARLLNGKPSDIAFMSNSSEAISMIAQALDLKTGDNVIINTLEFPSDVLPWLLLKRQGVEVRVVEHHQGQVSVSDIMAQADDRTRLVVTSHVSYITGARFDYKELYEQLKGTRTLLLLDVTQSLGVVPVDMNYADFTVCSSYKWLLAFHGLGILAVNPARIADLQPRYVGWRSVADMFSPDRFESFAFHEDARKFELGYPSYSAIYALHFSSNLILELGVERIERHVLELGGQLIERLTAGGFDIMTPLDPACRAGNISVATERGEEIAKELLNRQVFVWGGDGRFRASVHLFNDTADIDTLMGLLPVG
jgi:selenocysteine lyase/cysteine desulfurase